MGAPTPREIAYTALRRFEGPGDFLEHRLESDPGFRALRTEDRRLAQELIYGVLRRKRTLDWLMGRRTNSRPQRPEIRRFLHLGLYQIFFLDRIPAHAAVHQTVELARHQGFGPESGFINAVLRGTLRELPTARQELAELEISDPGIAFSHPSWWVDRWRHRLPTEDLRRWLQRNNTPPPTYARVNSLCTTAEKLGVRWREEGVEAIPRSFAWVEPQEQVFELRHPPPLASLPSFQSGDFYIQDPSTVLAVHLLDPRPGERILDACAAPGGKTTLIAARMNDRGSLIAEDASADRLQFLGENLARLRIHCVQSRPVLNPVTPETKEGEFDRILADVPCSNTGVLRRRVEARWRLQPENLVTLREEQKGILNRASRRLRPGGVLVYSTCSLEPEENQEAIDEFLKSSSEFSLDTIEQLVPWRDDVDGAFAARLRRHG